MTSLLSAGVVASTTQDIEIGIVSSLLASAITYVLVVLFRFRLPSVSHILFWRHFAEDLVVLISEMQHDYDPRARRDAEQPPLTPLGDAVTLADFLRFLKRRLKAEPTVVSVQNQDAFEAYKHRNLLVIGGPKYNYGAQALLLELDARLPYQFRRLRPLVTEPYQADDPHLKKFVGVTEHAAVYESDPDNNADFGCVVMAENPYNEKRRVLIVGGLSTLATIGAGEWLQGTHPKLWWRARRTGFEAIVGCRTSGITRVSHVEPKYLAYLSSESA